MPLPALALGALKQLLIMGGIGAGMSYGAGLFGGESEESTTTKQQRGQREALAVLADKRAFNKESEQASLLDPILAMQLARLQSEFSRGIGAPGDYGGGDGYDDTDGQLGPEMGEMLSALMGEAGGEPVTPDRIARATAPRKPSIAWLEDNVMEQFA